MPSLPLEADPSRALSPRLQNGAPGVQTPHTLPKIVAALSFPFVDEESKAERNWRIKRISDRDRTQISSSRLTQS